MRCVGQRETYSLGGSPMPPSNYHVEMCKLGRTGRSQKNSGHSLVRLDHSQRRSRCSQQDFDHSLTRLFLPGFPWESPIALSSHVACLRMSFVCCRFLGRQRSAVWGSPVTPTLREKNEFEAEVQSQGLTWIMLRERGEKRTCTRKDRSLVRVGVVTSYPQAIQKEAPPPHYWGLVGSINKAVLFPPCSLSSF